MTALYSTETGAVQRFLEKEIPEIDASLIRIIEWRPSLNFYKEAYVKLLSLVVEFIKRMDAGKKTAAIFGRRWVRNFFKNLNYLNQILLYRTAEIPVIVTGSGPGLETAMPVIRNMQDSCLILAASSSIMALAHGGVCADMVIATDGGPWALRHIYPCYRKNSGVEKYDGSHRRQGLPKPPDALATNLCAALPSQCGNTPFLVLNDGSFWQSVVLHELAVPSVVIPQRGTVTASAVELAMLLSGGNIYLAGMDLSVRDIRTHARPYSFDSLLFNRANRFTPVYSESFIRSGLIKDGGSMDIYAAWFKNQLAMWPKRIFSFGGSSEVFENAIPSEQAAEKNKREYFKTVCVKEDPALFCKRGASALLKAMREGKFAEKLKTELVQLLFPGEKEVTEGRLETAVKEVSHV